MCLMCGRSPFAYENIGRHMSEENKKYFQAPNTLLMNALRKVDSVIRFHQTQYDIMQKNVDTMQLNSSFLDCTQSLEHFGDISEITDISDVCQIWIDMRKNRVFMIAVTQQRKEDEIQMSMKTKMKVVLLHSIKTAANLIIIFGDKDRNDKMEPKEPVGSSNPYMKYISRKNTQSSVLVIKAPLV
uniref:Uncharacterized protein n=1 Tax=Setaria digitata TaxID=48799 RepID=A0A915PJD0_9BILA